ncbi:hypothetical protein MASR1M68_01790 [Elusimicrobiota bacterium]
MKNVRKILFGSLLLLPFCVSTMFAGECTGMKCMNKNEKGQSCKMCQKREKMADKMMADLKVTPEQKTKLEELKNNHKTAVKVLRDQLDEKKKALVAELSKDSYDNAIIENLKNDVKEIAGSIAVQKANTAVEMRKILTKEQFNKLEANKPKMKMKKMNGNMPPPMPMEE